jgi:hypothetical protein
MVNEKTYHLPFAFGKGTPPSRRRRHFEKYRVGEVPSFWKEGWREATGW